MKHGKYVILLFLMLIISISGCKKQSYYCGVEKPMEDIAWLKDKVKNNPPNLRIYKLTYNGIEGFEFVNCYNATCNGVNYYYKTCDDSALYESGGLSASTYPNDFAVKTTYQELIYPM